MYTCPYCTIICQRICLLFCILGLYVYLTACLIFCSVFLLCFIVFLHQITHYCILLMFCRFLSVCLPRLPCFFCRFAFSFVVLEAFGYLTFVFRFLFVCADGFLLFFFAYFVSLFFLQFVVLINIFACPCFAVSFCFPVCFLAFLLFECILLELDTP